MNPNFPAVMPLHFSPPPRGAEGLGEVGGRYYPKPEGWRA